MVIEFGGVWYTQHSEDRNIECRWKAWRRGGRRKQQNAEGLGDRFSTGDSWTQSPFFLPSISLRDGLMGVSKLLLPAAVFQRTTRLSHSGKWNWNLSSRVSFELCLHSSLFDCGYTGFDRKWKLTCSEMDVADDGLLLEIQHLSICVPLPTRRDIFLKNFLSFADRLAFSLFVQFAVFWPQHRGWARLTL